MPNCIREDCFAFKTSEPHNCKILDDIDFDGKPCSFYKLKPTHIESCVKEPVSFDTSERVKERPTAPKTKKQDMICKHLMAAPHHSDRSIAAEIGVDHKTVAAQRARLEAAGIIRVYGWRRTTDGRMYPARRTSAEGDGKRLVGEVKWCPPD